MARSEIYNELKRLMSKPKMVFNKGLLDTDNDKYNGYVTDFKNMEVNEKGGAGAVSKRKGTIVMNSTSDAVKYILLEEIAISGCKMQLGISTKRDVVVFTDAFPNKTIDLCREGQPYFTSDNSTFTYECKFKSGEKFWLLDDGSFYFIVANTGEAYRIDKQGQVKFAARRSVGGTTTLTTSFDELRTPRTNVAQDICCYVDIVDATNKQLDKFYIADNVLEGQHIPTAGSYRAATVNDAGVVSVFSDPITLPDYGYRAFSTAPIVNLKAKGTALEVTSGMSEISFWGEPDSTSSDDIYLARLNPGSYKTYNRSTFPSTDAETGLAQVASDVSCVLMYAMSEREMGRDSDNINIGSPATSLSDQYMYLAVPRRSSEARALNLGRDSSNNFLKLKNINLKTLPDDDGAGTPSTFWNIRKKPSWEGKGYGDITTYIEEGNEVSGTWFSDLAPSTIDSYQTNHTEITYAGTTANSYTNWDIYALHCPPEVHNMFKQKNPDAVSNIVIEDSTDSSVKFSYCGIICDCDVELITDTSSGSTTGYVLPILTLVLDSNVTESIVACEHKKADHWDFENISFLTSLNSADPLYTDGEQVNPYTYEYQLKDAADAFLTGSDTTINNAFLSDRIAIWNDGDIISISQKAFGCPIAKGYGILYAAYFSKLTPSSPVSNSNINDEYFPATSRYGNISGLVRHVVSPITVPMYSSIRRAPYKISEFTNIITDAGHLVFNAGKLFVSQGQRLWIGDSSLLLKIPVEINSSIHHMVAFHDGVLLFTDNGVIRVNNKGQLFYSQNYNALKVISSGTEVFFVTSENQIFRGKLMFSENNVPYIKFDNISAAISNFSFNATAIMTYFNNRLYVSNGMDIYRFNSELNSWDKHASFEKEINMLSHYKGKLIVSLYHEPERYNSYDVADSEAAAGGGYA